MNRTTMKAIHLNTARKILEAGQPCDLKLWRMTDGSILHYRNCIGISRYVRGASHKVKMLDSGEIRRVFDYMIFEINDMEVYL